MLSLSEMLRYKIWHTFPLIDAPIDSELCEFNIFLSTNWLHAFKLTNRLSKDWSKSNVWK